MLNVEGCRALDGLPLLRPRGAVEVGEERVTTARVADAARAELRMLLEWASELRREGDHKELEKEEVKDALRRDRGVHSSRRVRHISSAAQRQVA